MVGLDQGVVVFQSKTKETKWPMSECDVCGMKWFLPPIVPFCFALFSLFFRLTPPNCHSLLIKRFNAPYSHKAVPVQLDPRARSHSRAERTCFLGFLAIGTRLEAKRDKQPRVQTRAHKIRVPTRGRRITYRTFDPSYLCPVPSAFCFLGEFILTLLILSLFAKVC